MGLLETNAQTLFTFEGTEGQEIVFNNLDDNFNQSVRLYNSANQSISSGFNRAITLDNTETYLATITNNNNAPEDFNFEVLLPKTTTEIINIGELVSDTIEVPGDDFIYTFDGNIDQRILFDGISDDTRNIDARLVSPSGVTLFSNQDVYRDRVPITLSEQGPYQIIVDGGITTTGDFSFQLLDAEIATPLTVNTPEMGTIDANSQTLFTFEGEAGQQIFFRNLDDDLSQFVLLYNSANQLVSRSSGFNTVTTLNSTETYLVSLFNNNNVPDDFHFEVIFPQTTTETLNFGEVINGTLNTPEDEFIYTFDGTIGQQILFDGISRDNSRIHARLVNPSGVNVFSNQDVTHISHFY
ncbi:MAG: hypothetical protein QNJ08_06555 [Crocosphaera sp.]|nr:hypothetical protein [Crocosphaera sp.]